MAYFCVDNYLRDYHSPLRASFGDVGVRDGTPSGGSNDNVDDNDDDDDEYKPPHYGQDISECFKDFVGIGLVK